MKTSPGRYFEDFRLGEVIRHATPRTVGPAEQALYTALYPTRASLTASAEAARAMGFAGPLLDDLVIFHTVFGKTVPDVSLNAVANLGYAEGRVLRHPTGTVTLRAESEVIGLKQTSSGKTGIVWVRTTGSDADGPVLDYVRWVLVRKRDAAAPAPQAVVPDLANALAPGDLVLPPLDWGAYDTAASGERWRLADYAVGEVIDHVDAATLTEAEHMLATRLWQNTARVHFDVTAREDARRLIYGGHILSLARALSGNGLANAQLIAGINGGTHANPAFAGDTVRAWSEVLDTADLGPCGALRLRLVATKGAAGALRDPAGAYLPEVLLDFDYWALIPK